MAITVTIAGVDYSTGDDAVNTVCGPSAGNPLTFTEALGQRNTLNFTAASQDGSWAPQRGEPVLMSADGVPLFGGYIQRVEMRKPSGIAGAFYHCICVAWEQMLDRRRCWAHTYVNETFGAIFASIVSNSLDAEGFTSGGEVVTGPTIALFEISEPRPTIREALDRLCEVASTSSATYYWDVTPDKDVRAFEPTTYPAPFSVTDADPNGVLLDCRRTETNEGLVNRVFVYLGQTLTETKSQDMVGDGSTRNFTWAPDGGPLAIGATPTIAVDGVPQTVGVRGVDSGKQWYWQQGSSDVEQDAGETVLTAGNTLTITAQGLDARTLGPYSDSDAIDAETALQGDGTGYYEAYLQLDDLSTQVDAAAAADAYLQAHKTAATTFEGATYTSGLRAGQSLTVDLAAIGIDDTLLIQSVTMTDQGGGLLLWSFRAASGQLLEDWTAKLLRGSGTATGTAISASGGSGAAGDSTIAIVDVSADTTLTAIEQCVEADTSGGDVTLTLPDCADWTGKLIIIEKTDAANVLHWAAHSGDTVNGATSGTLSDQWSSITILATGDDTAVIVSDAATTTTTAPAAPGNVTLGTPTYEESDDRATLRINQPFTAPGPLGTFRGVWVQIEAPDQSSAAYALLDGTQTLGAGAILSGPPAPQVFGPFTYDSSTPWVTVEIERPTSEMDIRVRLISYSDQITNDAAGSPSTTVHYTPSDAPKPNAGTTYADVVTGYSVSVTTRVAGGVSTTEIRVSFTRPTSARPFDGIYHRVVYTLADGTTATNTGVIWASGQVANRFPTPPIQTAQCYALSYAIQNGEDKVNNYVAGITPETTATIGNTLGSTGTEYAADVTDLSVSVVRRVVGGVDTTFFYVSFTRPSDPRWYGVYVGVTYDTDDGDTTTNWGVIQDGSGADPSNYFPTPNTVQTATIEVRSYSVIEGTDSVNTAGPSTTASIGTAGGTIDIRKAISASFNSAEFHVDPVTLKWSMNGVDFSKGFNGFDTGTAAIPKITVKDGAGNAIGWIGDDTASSGYVGAWFKRVMIGGTSPATAKIVADASGNVAISGSLIAGNISGNAANITGTLSVSQIGSGTLPVGVVYAGSVNASQITAGTITTVGTGVGVTVKYSGAGNKLELFPGFLTMYDAAGASRAGIVVTDSQGSYMNLYGAAGALIIHFNALDGVFGQVPGLYVYGNKVVGARGSAVTAPTGGTTVDSQARTAINDIISRLQAHGLIS